MQHITAAQVDEMRANGYDRSTIAEAEAWLVKCQEAELLIDEITAAFANVVLEGSIGLRESNGLDDHFGPEEQKRLHSRDEKLDWRKIPAELLKHCNAAFSFLNARGVHFHLPAFLTSELRGEYVNGAGILTLLIDNSIYAQGYMALLSPRQKAVIVKSLEFAKFFPGWANSHEEIDQAIARFL
jgi:hypothetical protein